ncbi:hypothetical protein [Pectobacterium polaris]|uniref:Uncharacterized protein n=1 Tax=Pectobacterium polaris TaxID=2042057 RepID=A0AAW5GK95_9GAMM|nr:hypothetical protein [Pectobacterium polaris]MCL6353305.1 hypothetical protein [Pectobacterium polaris]MCL6370707.1 hypothetical protein [Pectobacterium polaris]
MKKNITVKPIDMVWQDPQSFCITEFIRDELFYYFKCWDYQSMLDGEVVDAGFLGCFNVENILAIKHIRFTKTETYPIDFENNFKCYYYEVNDSPWLKDVLKERVSNDKEWEKHDTNKYKHFVLENAKYWIDVIGSNLTFEKKEKDKRRIEFWENF